MVAAAQAQAQWQTTFPAALKLAAQTHKPVFVDFYAEWCGPCKMLEQNVFSDSRVKALFQHTICLRLDVDQHQEEARKFQVTSIPRLMLFSSDGKRVMWDTMGYREADDFVQEFSEALSMKAPGKAVAPAAVEPPAIAKVHAAVSSGGLARLEAADPATAKAGLRMLVAKLGVFNEADFQPPAALLESAGRDALPELVEGLQSKTLAVRVGAYKVMEAILSKDSQSKGRLAFDPWAPANTRTAQLVVLRHLVSER